MAKKKVRYERGKGKNKWNKHIRARVDRYQDDSIDEDVRVVVDNCVQQVESKMKLCASYEKMLDSEPNVNERGIEDSTGRYVIIDLRTLNSNLIQAAVCKSCQSELNVTEIPESRYGLGSKLTFTCTNSDCGACVKFDSTPKENRRYQINSQMVLASRSCGIGRSGAIKLLSLLNLGEPVAQHPWTAATKMWENLCATVREESCKNAVTRAVNRVKINEKINSDGSVNVATGFDGSWKVRGYTSPEGLVSAVSEDTSQVLDISYLVNTCRTCNMIEASKAAGEIDDRAYYGKLVKHHETCSKNHDGSAASMESRGVIDIYKRSTDEKIIRYHPFIGDGDSSAFKNVRDLNPYGPDAPLIKDECVVHVTRRFGRNLRKAKESMKGTGLVGKGKFTKGVLAALLNFYGWALREYRGDPERMSQAVWAILRHYQENADHTLCPSGSDSWCSYQRDKTNGTVLHQKIKNPLSSDVVAVLEPVFETHGNVEFLGSCYRAVTQNPNESYHHIVWGMARKDIYCSPSETSIAVDLGVGIFNNGFRVTMKHLYEAAGINVTGSMLAIWKKVDKNRVHHSVYNSSEKTKKTRKSNRREKFQRESAFKRYEVGEYKTAAFHETRNATRNKKKGTKRKSTSCKCGATSHARTSNKFCPLNKKNKM